MAMKWIASGLWLIGASLLVSGCGKAQVTEAPAAEAPVTEAAATSAFEQQVFTTPEEAVAAMAALVGKHDEQAVERVFGVGSADMFDSGDEQADAEDYARVKAMIDEALAFQELDADMLIALLGAAEWPWPIPLVKAQDGWRFDTEAGREELLNRRVGRNELATLATLHEIVDAQAEFAGEGRDGNPPAFAARFVSSEGKRDGLYWDPVDGEPLSPLGDLLADSEYQSGQQEPFQGYYYRILKAQGPSAPGGERSYLDAQDLLTGGFAVAAWPAKYGNSGIMTFLISHRGIAFQKDLGAETTEVAEGLAAFDPDSTWQPTADHLGLVETQ